MKKSKRLIIVFSLFFCSFLLNGSGLKGLTLDFTQIYDCITADDIISTYDKRGEDIAKKLYDDRNVYLLGKVDKSDDDDKIVILKGITSNSTTRIECEFEDSISLKNINGKIIGVYGTIDFSIMGNLEMEALSYSICSETTLPGTLSPVNSNTFYSLSEMERLKFEDSGVGFYVPQSWKDHGYYDNTDSNYSFYQFNLHALNNQDDISTHEKREKEQKESTMDVLYVLYLDSNGINSKYRSNNSKVEKAILENLFGKDDSLWGRWKTASVKNDDFTYDYYTADYVKSFHKEKYTHTDIVFVPYKGNGMVMFLYLHDEANQKNINDINAVIRTLK